MRSDRAVRSMLALTLTLSFAACGGSGDDDDAAEPVATAEPAEPAEPAPAADEAETTPSEPAVEPVDEPAGEPEPDMTEPTDVSVMPEPTEPAEPDPDDEPMPTVDPNETVSFDRNAAFRDEFDGQLLPEAGWAWLGEEADRWRFEDGQLVITGDNPHFMGEPVNVLTRIVPDEMELSISTSVTANLQENFEAAGMMLMNDRGEYTAILLGYCDGCMPEGGAIGIYGEAMSGEDNLLTEPAMVPWDAADPVTLNMGWSQGNEVVVAGYFDADGEYQSVFRVDAAPGFTHFGLYAHNLPMGGENTVDVEGRFDWFELKVYEP